MVTGKKKFDSHLKDFEEALRISIEENLRGKFESLEAPGEVLTRRRGRPQGSTKENPKVSTTIRLSPEVISAFKSTGTGWQTRIDAALKDWLIHHPSRKTLTKI